MEVDSPLRRTFHPQSGAVARRMARDLAFGSFGSERFPARKTPSSTHALLSPASKLTAARQPVLKQPQYSSLQLAMDGKNDLSGRMQLGGGCQLHCETTLAPARLLERGETVKSGLQLRAGGSSSLWKSREPGALLGRSASQPNAVGSSEGKPPSIMDLVTAARRKLQGDELPSSQGQASRGGLGRQVQQLLPQQGASHGSSQCTSAVGASEGRRRQQVSEAKPSGWTIEEESSKLTQELVRLGKQPEPMKWANEEVENKWLRREATYEMFKALVNTGCAPEDSAGKAAPYECSTRTPTPDTMTVLACEPDALSNFMVKDGLCAC